MRRELLTGRFSKTLCESPKSAQGQHFEIAHDGIHEIEGEILLALLDVPEMIFFAANSRGNSGLRFTPIHSQFRDGQSKDLSWRIRSSRVVSADGFGHKAIVAVTSGLKQQL